MREKSGPFKSQHTETIYHYTQNGCTEIISSVICQHFPYLPELLSMSAIQSVHMLGSFTYTLHITEYIYFNLIICVFLSPCVVSNLIQRSNVYVIRFGVTEIKSKLNEFYFRMIRSTLRYKELKSFYLSRRTERIYFYL